MREEIEQEDYLALSQGDRIEYMLTEGKIKEQYGYRSFFIVINMLMAGTILLFIIGMLLYFFNHSFYFMYHTFQAWGICAGVTLIFSVILDCWLEYKYDEAIKALNKRFFKFEVKPRKEKLR